MSEDWIDGLPPVGTVCEHHSGRIYRVTGYANDNTERPKQYPVTIIYQNVDNGTVWCRPASEWARSFRPIRSEEDRLIDEALDVLEADGDDKRTIYSTVARMIYHGYRKQ